MCNSDYIIWVGSVFTREEVLKNIAISPAANKWQLNFISALINSGINVKNLGHLPERVFPFGRIFVNKRASQVPDRISLISSSYLNLPFFRIFIINLLSLIKIARLLSKEYNRPLYIISYNTYSYNVAPILYAKYIGRIRWITIVADPVSDSSKKINPFNRFADASVFLSYKLFTECKSENKLHFDGAVTKITDLDKKVLQNTEKSILYAGAIAKHTGVELLVQASTLVKTKNLKLIICGKGRNEVLEKAARTQTNIVFLGMVDDNKLMSLYNEAYAFINPRLISSETNFSNFPSKLLEYISYSKPVISSFTGGIHPVYKEIIQFVYSDDPQELADKINEVVAWDEIKYLQVSEKMKSFVEQWKMWPNIIKDFHKWATGI
jgi:glycosyltransferase involved in cell wall biosynthesis